MIDLNKKDMKWEMVKLKDLCKINSGGTPSRSVPKYYSGSIPWAKISDIESANRGLVFDTEEHITKEGLASINNKIFPRGTLLLAIYGSVGKVAFAGVDMSTNQAILGIRIIDNKRLDYLFLKFWFETIKAKLLYRAVGGTLQNISLGIVQELEIPLPPLPTQKRIAEILDKADTLHRKDQELIKKYDELAKAIFIDMFGDPVRNEKGWKTEKLEDVCLDIVDCPHSTPIHSVGTSNFPCIRTSELINGRIDWSSMKYVDEETYFDRTKRLKPQENDIVYGREGTFGEAILIPKGKNICLGQRTMLFRPNTKKVNPIFLWYQTRSKGVYRQALKKTNGSTVGHINVADVRKFVVFLPEIELQNRFSDLIQNCYRQYYLSNSSKCFTESLFQSLLQQVFRR